MRALPATSRTSPTKLARPPIPVLPCVNAASSAPRSKSSRCTRTVNSPSRYRREQGHLVGRPQPMIPADIVLVDRHAHDPLVLERFGESRAARLQPIKESRHRGDIARQLDLFLGLADLGTEPSEIQHFHQFRPLRLLCQEAAIDGKG